MNFLHVMNNFTNLQKYYVIKILNHFDIAQVKSVSLRMRTKLGL